MNPVVETMRDQFARCAVELFGERGIDKVTLDEISARAGVTKGSLYYHYDSKKEVVLAACAHFYREWEERARTAMAASTSPIEQLRGVLRMTVQSYLRDAGGRLFASEICSRAFLDEEIRAGLAGFYDTVRELLVGMVDAACRSGQMQVADPLQAVTWMLATIEGLKLRAAFEPQICESGDTDALVDALVRILTASPVQKGEGRRRPIVQE
jgi:AcrR family transcriptional regulator